MKRLGLDRVEKEEEEGTWVVAVAAVFWEETKSQSRQVTPFTQKNM